MSSTTETDGRYHDTIIRDLLKSGYNLIIDSLPKKKREELGIVTA